MSALLSEIIALLTGGITGIAQGLGEGLGSLVKYIFVDGTGVEADPYTLTVFGSLIIVFAGISLAIGLSRFIVNWVTSFGN